MDASEMGAYTLYRGNLILVGEFIRRHQRRRIGVLPGRVGGPRHIWQMAGVYGADPSDFPGRSGFASSWRKQDKILSRDSISTGKAVNWCERNQRVGRSNPIRRLAVRPIYWGGFWIYRIADSPTGNNAKRGRGPDGVNCRSTLFPIGQWQCGCAGNSARLKTSGGGVSRREIHNETRPISTAFLKWAQPTSTRTAMSKD